MLCGTDSSFSLQSSRSLVRKLALLSLVVLCVANLGGCGGSEFGPIGSVTGSLMIDDEPVTEGTKVIFMHPLEGHAGFGFTDSNGDFSIEWRREGTTYKGLPVGGYEVMIVEASVVDIDELSADEMLAGAVPEMPRRTMIPRKYLRASTSGLKYNIEAGENKFDIQISSK